VEVAISAHCLRPSSRHSSGLAVASCDSFFMNFAFARRTELMLNVKLFKADIDLVNLTMLLPMVEEMGAEVGPVTRLFKGTSNVRPAVDSLRKSGDEHGEEELGESGDEATVEDDEDEEADIVGEEELGSMSLASIFGDIEAGDKEVGGTDGSNSDMVARLFLIRPMLKLCDSPGSTGSTGSTSSPGFSLSGFFSRFLQGNNKQVGNLGQQMPRSLLTPISQDARLGVTVFSMEMLSRAAKQRRILLEFRQVA
jgi:hypothetical protein